MNCRYLEDWIKRNSASQVETREKETSTNSIGGSRLPPEVVLRSDGEGIFRCGLRFVTANEPSLEDAI